jgi:hypothetical protein
MRLIIPALPLLLVACQPDAAPCPDCPTCPEAPAQPAAGSAGVTLEPWEAALFQEQIDRLRTGIQPFGDKGWGVCTGSKRCERFEGAEAGLLPPGKHMLRAELSVPNVGSNWTVRMDHTCMVTPAAGQPSERTHSRTMNVAYAGETRGYRLEPLLPITSPAPDGKRSCTATLVPIAPNGSEGAPIKASWSVPGPGPG